MSLPGAVAIANSPPIRLIIVDDQPVIRRGLSMMLGAEPDIDVVAQAANGAEAIALAIQHRPDVVVMDLQMPRVGGVVATREITAALPQTRIVVLTTFDDDELVFEAIRAGAQAYLLKDSSEAEVLATVRSVHLGESRLSPGIARKLLDQFRLVSARAGQDLPPAVESLSPESSRPRHDLAEEQLTEREARILDLLAKGLSNKQIAATVFLAEGTVKNYVSRIMEKWHARNRIELAMRAVSRRPPVA